MKYLKNYNSFILENNTFFNRNLTTLKDLDIPEKINDYFNCSHNQLTSLEFGPKTVSKHFSCDHNLLTSLEFAPKTIGGSFSCSFNKLTSLKGCPTKVPSDFCCYNNNLINLEYSPEFVGGNFNCYENELISLIGAPKEINDSFYCQRNNLTSLEGAPKKVSNNFNCSRNKLKTLDYLPEIGGTLYCFDNEWIKPIPYEIFIKHNMLLIMGSFISTKHVYTLGQYRKFSSFEFQKEFLEREPENYLDLKPIGYADGIEQLFPHLFDMDELGLID
jgi:hypothetical protein